MRWPENEMELIRFQLLLMIGAMVLGFGYMTLLVVAAFTQPAQVITHTVYVHVSPTPTGLAPPRLPAVASRSRMITAAGSEPVLRQERPATRHSPSGLGPTAGRSTFSALEIKIRACESGDLISTYDYTLHGGPSSASGGWQFLDGTWDHYAGYARAWLAPRAVQDRYARAYFDKHGYRAWQASKHCWG